MSVYIYLFTHPSALPNEILNRTETIINIIAYHTDFKVTA